LKNSEIIAKKTALVTKSVGSWYDLYTTDKQIIKGRLKGKFKIEDKKLTNPIAVGDKVQYTIENKAENTAIIEEILPRQNYIVRKSSHKSEHSHLIAANIDELFLVISFSKPETSLGFIDRFLVAAESFQIPVTIVINKIDLLKEKQQIQIDEFEQIYPKLNYKVLKVSAEKEVGLDALKKQTSGKMVLFSGHSGVGKSTLMNKIFPGLNQKTLEISNFSGKGVHSTTFAEIFIMDENTFLIDTPGIKEFGLIDIETEELSHYFPEMRNYLGKCKFHNCQHINEPGCRVLKALEAGEIAISRYKSYISMVENEDNRR
jgi:ribosome biogenesis GTPase